MYNFIVWNIASDQILQFKNQHLSNDIDTVQDCGIDDESVIELSQVKVQSSPSATPYEEPEELDEETKQVRYP